MRRYSRITAKRRPVAAYTAIPTSSGGGGGSTLGPDWFSYLATYFQVQSGIAPLAWSVAYENDFGATSFPPTGSQSQGFVVGGTGAAAAYAVPSAGTGGVIKVTGPTSGAGFADFNVASNQSANSFIGNLQTKRWMIGFRVCCGKAPSAASSVSIGVTSGSTYVGIGYLGAQANWQYSRGASPTNVVDTGKAITVDSSGLTFLTMVVGCLDLTHVGFNADLVGSSGAAPTNAEAQSNLASSLGYPYFWNEGTGAGDILFYDKVIVCTEL